MGVDEAVLGQRNKKVMLRRAGHGQDKIAPRDRSFGRDEARSPGNGEVARDAAVAQSVAGGRRHPGQRAGDEADAVEPMRRIAAV